MICFCTRGGTAACMSCPNNPHAHVRPYIWWESEREPMPVPNETIDRIADAIVKRLREGEAL